jgi:protein TonB
MIVISRPLSYSLLVHFCLLCIFIFTLTHHSKKESKTVLKLRMISLSSPLSPSVPKKPTLPQPKKEIMPDTMQKTAPIIPAPIIQKALAPVPTAHPMPTVAPQPIVRPNTPTLSTPPSEAVQAPKAVPQPIPNVNIEKEFLDAHLGEIRALLIQNLKYPRNAQRLKMQGEVRVSFRLKSDGSVENIEVIQSSGFELLDEDTRALIKNTASQFPKPTKSISLSIPLSYLLR